VIPLLRRLRAQTIRDRMEIVFVTTTLDELEADEEWLSVFASWKVVAIGALSSMATSRVAGVRAATCPYIAFTEQHCFPEDTWAAAIVDAFETRGAAAVGPVMGNANPQLARSWVNLTVEYGHWMAPHSGGWMDHLPGHNVAYRRDLLMALGDLTTAMETEYSLHLQWRQQGRRLWLEPEAHVYHTNITTQWDHLRAACAFQRPWARSRAQDWGWPRRVVYALSWPLIVLVRLPRVVSNFRRAPKAAGGLVRMMPSILMNLTAASFGEFLGYAGSVGNANAVLLEIELYRERYLSPKDTAAKALFD